MKLKNAPKTTVLQIEKLDLPAWLAAQDSFPKFYWKCRKTGEETAALGSLADFFKIPDLSRDLPDSYRLYGALSFTQKQSDLLWQDFSPAFFFLPQVEVFQSSTKTVLKTQNPDFVFKQPHPIKAPTYLKMQKHTPSEENWDQSIETILKAIQAKKIQKVVLARKSTFEIQGNPFGWLNKLIAESSLNSTVFALQKNASSLFLGATPEMLYERKNSLLFTESLAGTRRRGTSLSEDLKLAEELKKNAKENKEFSLVKEFLFSTLPALCEEFSCDSLDSLVQTSKVQHLYNSFQGTLKPTIQDSTLLSLLHPTPAIGGFPRKDALAMIDALEDFDRGLYAGAIGWVSPNHSSFAVAIRSALIENGLLHTFAGTGIVEGSISSREWLELDDKISHWRL